MATWASGSDGDASNGGANWVDKDTSEDAGLEIKQGGVTSGGQVVLTFDGSAPGANAGEAAIAGTYGTLYIQANGQYRYVLDNMNPATQALDVGSNVSEVFHYTIGNSGAGSATPRSPSTFPARTTARCSRPSRRPPRLWKMAMRPARICLFPALFPSPMSMPATR